MKLKVLFFLTIFFFAGKSSFAQISDYLLSGSFDWSYWEAFKSDQEKASFISKSDLGGSVNSTNSKVVDINGDELPDIINTPSANKTILYLNTGSGFKTLLDVDQTLLMVGRPKPWAYVYLLTKDPNCCGDGYYSINYLRPGFDADGELRYFFEQEIEVKNDLELINENLPPFRFEAKSDVVLKFSADPSASDIQKCPTGETGFAVASKKGADDKIWWLVLLPDGDQKLKAGWLPSEELKRKF